MSIQFSQTGQAMPEKTITLDASAFDTISGTDVYWLGNASLLINSRGTIILIDPILDSFDMPLLIDMPIASWDIPRVDALLISHIDNDHLSFDTLEAIKGQTKSFHAPAYVADVMKEKGFETQEHVIGEVFEVNGIKITPTPTKHNWQSEKEKYNFREWREEEYVGYWIETLDGKLWLPSDSRLLPEHLEMDNPDVIFFDFSDNEWHIGYDNALLEARTYPNADLVCIHWGSVDAFDWAVFNGNPDQLRKDIVNPDRVYDLPVGGKLAVTKKS